MRIRFACSFVALWLVQLTIPLEAQRLAADAPAFEFTIPSLGRALEGVPLRVQGQMLAVSGLADLSPAARQNVEVAFRHAPGDTVDWNLATTDANGFFLVEVPLPESRAAGNIVIRAEHSEHEIELPLRPGPRMEISLRTDRRFYEVDETIHAWAVVRDAVTGAPKEGVRVRFNLDSDPGRAEATVVSGLGGVAYHAFDAVTLRRGDAMVYARAGSSSTDSLDISFGQRTPSPLFVELEVPDEPVQPGGRVQVTVRARAQTGEPIEGANVEVQVGEQEAVRGLTDEHGELSLEAQVPVLSQLSPQVVARVAHPVHGRAEANETVRVARGNSFNVTLTPRHGALMADVASEVWLTVQDGWRPAQNQAVTVRGARGFRRELQTNEHGVVRFDVAAKFEDAAPTSDCGVGVFFEVILGEGPGATHRKCVAISAAPVRATIRERVVLPGQEVHVDIERRRRGPVVVQLAVGDIVSQSSLIITRLVDGQVTESSTLRFRAPMQLGLAQVRAFTLGEGEEPISARVVDTFLVRPEPHFSSVTARFDGDGADVDVQGGGEGWIAVDVRDLAQHGGERAFRDSFLGGRFRRAVLAPESAADHALLAASLASFSRHRSAGRMPVGLSGDREGASGTSLDHDARFLAEEFRLRGVEPFYRHIEQRLEADPAGVAVGEGRRRRFRDDVLAGMEGFAGRSITPAQLEASDPSFSFEHAARRRARAQLVRVLNSATSVEGEEDLTERIISRLLQEGSLSTSDTVDPWGGVIGFRPRPANVHMFFRRSEETLAFPGPDGRLGTSDDIVDPFARVVPEGTPYAVASGEDALMRVLSLSAAGEEALQAMSRALEEMTRAMNEDRAGDIATGSDLTSDDGSIGLSGMGTIGHGGGSGFGRAAGGLRGRNARAPRIRSGNASIRPGPGSAVLGAIRDNLPGTVHFLPVRATDAQGNASVRVPLPPSATTFLVEVIHWQRDGWRSSSSARFESRLPIAVQASAPTFATVGDSLRIPVRAHNGTAQPQSLEVSIDGGALGTTGPATQLTVDASSRGATHARFDASTPGVGHLVVAAVGAEEGDRLRSELVVRPRGLRRELVRDGVHVGEATVEFNAPADGEATVFIEAGAAIFPSFDPGWVAWSHVLAGRRPRAAMVNIALGDLDHGYAQARGLSIAWRSPRLEDERVQEIVERRESEGPVHDGLWLLAAAPALRDAARRPALRSLLERFLRAQQERLVEAASETTEDATVNAITAAVLLTYGESRHRGQAEEFARRARRKLLRVGDALWVEEANTRWPLWASAFLAYADLLLGQESEAAALIRTLSTYEGETTLSIDIAQSMARVVASRLGSIRAVRAQSGGEVTTIALRRGSGEGTIRIPAGESLRLSGSGMFRARVTLPIIQAWRSAPQAPLMLERVAPSEALREGGRAEWSVRLQNRSPRLIRNAVVRIELPAGAAIESASLQRLHAAHGATIEGGSLLLRVGPIFPGRTRNVPVAIRLGVGGILSGFGVVAHPARRPDAFTVLPSQRLEIGGAQ